MLLALGGMKNNLTMNGTFYPTSKWFKPLLFQIALIFSVAIFLTPAPIYAQDGAVAASRGDCKDPLKDTDKDGTPDCHDWCPTDKNKTEPGNCGCGVKESDKDSDHDGTPDCKDECPWNKDKVKKGVCGCDFKEADEKKDSDGDGTPDCVDECPRNPHTTKKGACNDCEAPGITKITVINKRKCKDHKFVGDIEISFNYIPELGGLDISWSSGSVYHNFVNHHKSNKIVVKDQMFKADGKSIKIKAEYRGNTGCNANMDAGKALSCPAPPVKVDPIDCFNPSGTRGGHGYITGISIDKIKKCSDRGTPHKKSDDYMDVKLTVHFSKLPSGGVLEISGMTSIYANVSSLSGTSYTFRGLVRLNHRTNSTLKAVFADFHSSHAHICPITVSSYYINSKVFDCEDPCNTYITPPKSHRAVTNFNAFKADRAVELEWATNQSFKSVSYILERSIDGNTYEKIKQITNSELSEELAYFKDFDQTPALGDNFYRLKQVFTDGTFEYTEVQKVNFGIDLEAISFFPNPAENELFIDLDEYQGKSGHLIISDQYGRVLEDRTFDEIPSDLIRLDFSKYINGLYFVRTKVDRSEYIAKKILISKMY